MRLANALNHIRAITTPELTPEQKARRAAQKEARGVRFMPVSRLPVGRALRYKRAVTFDATIEVYQDRETWKHFYTVTGYAHPRPTEFDLSAYVVTQSALFGPFDSKTLAERDGRAWAQNNLAFRTLGNEYGPMLRLPNRLIEVPNRKEYWILPGRGTQVPHARKHVWCIEFDSEGFITSGRRVPWEDVILGDPYCRNADDTDRTDDAIALWRERKPLIWTYSNIGDEPYRDQSKGNDNRVRHRAVSDNLIDTRTPEQVAQEARNAELDREWEDEWNSGRSWLAKLYKPDDKR